jgi:hypothetical protein
VAGTVGREKKEGFLTAQTPFGMTWEVGGANWTVAQIEEGFLASLGMTCRVADRPG